jgi:cell division transport system permease protein
MNKRTANQGNRYNLKKALGIWLMQHAQACVFSMGQIFKNPLNSLLTTAVVGIALALPTGFYLLLENCQRVATGWDNSAEISLFLKLEVGEERQLSLAEEIRQLPSIASVDHISREAALAEFQGKSGFNEALKALEENPLPAILLLQPKFQGLNRLESGQLMQSLRAFPEVDTAQFDRQWIQRLFAIIEIVRQAVIVFSILLALAVLLIVGNTIRLAIYNRRTEIEVNKLFGATEAFIQRPFLYSGLFHGIGGGLLAWGLISLSLFLMDSPVARLADLYSSHFELQGLSLRELSLLVAGGGGLGLAGSWVSVQRHIKAIEPA